MSKQIGLAKTLMIIDTMWSNSPCSGSQTDMGSLRACIFSGGVHSSGTIGNAEKMIKHASGLCLFGIFLLIFCTDAVANQSCPDGKRKGPDTAGNCCWPDQVWVNDMCVGEPSCPNGFVANTTQEGLSVCETQACPSGMERQFDNVNCCWPGQGWSLSKNACVGAPQCPPDHVVEGNQCVSLADLEERKTTELKFKRERLEQLEREAIDLAVQFKSLYDSYKWDFYSDGQHSSTFRHKANILDVCQVSIAESKAVPMYNSSRGNYLGYKYEFDDCNATVRVGAQRQSNDDEYFDFSCHSGLCPDGEDGCAELYTPDGLGGGGGGRGCWSPRLKSYAQCSSHNAVAEKFSNTCYEWRQLKVELSEN